MRYDAAISKSAVDTEACEALRRMKENEDLYGHKEGRRNNCLPHDLKLSKGGFSPFLNLRRRLVRSVPQPHGPQAVHYQSPGVAVELECGPPIL